jgi:hypothetical protein
VPELVCSKNELLIYNIALSAQQLSVWDFIIPTPPPQPVRLSIYDRLQYDEGRCFALSHQGIIIIIIYIASAGKLLQFILIVYIYNYYTEGLMREKMICICKKLYGLQLECIKEGYFIGMTKT